MIKKVFPLIAFLLFFQVPAFAAGSILVVQSLPIKPYNEALRGFSSVCGGATRKLASSELSAADIAGKVREGKPDLILAIGLDALLKVKDIRDVPIVYLMVLNPQSLVPNSGNITGVSMNVAPEKQLSILRQALPNVRKIGLPFDPDKSGAFVAKAKSAAASLDIELLSKKVQSSRDAAAALDGMKGIDSFWMLPDTTVVNPGTVDLLLLSAIEKGIPVLTFSEKYVEKGALLSLEVDAAEAGRQAGKMANRILAGTDVKNIGKEDAQGAVVTVNLIVAKKLRITVHGNLLKHARIIK